jgi:hypothetical protein
MLHNGRRHVDEDMSPKEYPFPEDPSRNDYRLFPDELENDALVLFHGTAEKDLASILKDGFRPPGQLASTSFANNSSVPLRSCSLCADRSIVERMCIGGAFQVA